MEYYIEAIRAAAEKCDPCELKDALDFLMGLAKDDYKAGALGLTEYGDIVNEYNDTLITANAINYI